jgi:hypothetical protein
MTPEDPIVGSAPTTRTENLEAAAAALAPHRALERIEALGRLVLATASVIGGALAGFGTLGDSAVADHPGWMVPSLALAVVAIVCGLAAVLGRTTHVNVDDLAAVEHFYQCEIVRRSQFARAAVTALALAILLAVLPAIRAATSSSSHRPASISTRWQTVPNCGRQTRRSNRRSAPKDLLQGTDHPDNCVNVSVELHE